MKVLNVNHILETSGGGGTAERTIQMSYFLAEENVECNVLSTDLYLSDKTKSYLNKVKITALPCVSKRFAIFKPNLFEVNRLVREADIIHLMNHWTVINVLVYFFIKLHKKPYVVCPAGALIIFGRSKIIKKIYNFFIGSKIIKNADQSIAVTKDEILQFLEYGVPPEKITIIPNGVRSENLLPKEIREEFRSKFNLGPSPFILFIGRLNPIKGPDLLIQAYEKIYQKFPDYNLVIAGPDEGLKKDLIDFSEKFHLQDRVKIIGGVQGTDKESAYQEAALLVIPSRQEAMSIVVLEAGIYGTPAVFTDQCGLSELSKLGYGIEVPVSVEGLALGVDQFLSNKPHLNSMRINLKNYVYDNYDWRNIIKLYIQLYEKILIKSTNTP